MTSISQSVKTPRPWFVSVTMPRNELADFEPFRLNVEKHLKSRSLPIHHLLVPEGSRHSTVFAVLRINSQLSGSSAEEFSNDIFRDLVSQNALIDRMRDALGAFNLEAVPKKIRCFDNGTTIQFDDDETLSEMRGKLRSILRPHVARVLGLYQSAKQTPADPPAVESLLYDENKSMGPRLFGSIARSPSRQDFSCLRWEDEIGSAPLRCEKVHLLVSDDALTNCREEGENDIVFPLASTRASP